MLVHIREGKGGFDRFVPLTPKLLHVLRAYWVVVRPSGDKLFPSIRSFKHALSPKTLRTALRRAGEEAGLDKPVRPHVLRHTYATHMLELGVDIRELQILLGHQSIQTTTRYTQVSTQHITRLTSPLDVSPQEALLLG
jgi:site-specific recombinase XerD